MIYMCCSSCLCRFCTRSNCRYVADICFARCCSAPSPVLCCADFSSRSRRKIYVARRVSPTRADQVKNMTVADFMMLVKEVFDSDKEGD